MGIGWESTLQYVNLKIVFAKMNMFWDAFACHYRIVITVIANINLNLLK